MKSTKWVYLATLVIFLSTAACATIHPGQMTLKEWKRSHLPGRAG